MWFAVNSICSFVSVYILPVGSLSDMVVLSMFLRNNSILLCTLANLCVWYTEVRQNRRDRGSDDHHWNSHDISYIWIWDLVDQGKKFSLIMFNYNWSLEYGWKTLSFCFTHWLLDVCEHMFFKKITLLKVSGRLTHYVCWKHFYLLVLHLDSWSFRIVDLIDLYDSGDFYLANENNV